MGYFIFKGLCVAVIICILASAYILIRAFIIFTSGYKNLKNPIYTVTDHGMIEAIKTANQTLDKFNTALKSGNGDFKYFSLKTRFETPVGGEHIWVNNVSIKDNKYFGVFDNLPESTTNVKLGDTIQIENDNISDWMYADNQKLEGGFTIRLLRKRMTEPERKQFDNKIGLIIED